MPKANSTGAKTSHSEGCLKGLQYTNMLPVGKVDPLAVINDMKGREAYMS